MVELNSQQVNTLHNQEQYSDQGLMNKKDYVRQEKGELNAKEMACYQKLLRPFDSRFTCPLSNQLLSDPVFIEKGQDEHVMFERKALLVSPERIGSEKVKTNSYFVNSLKEYREGMTEKCYKFARKLLHDNKGYEETLKVVDLGLTCDCSPHFSTLVSSSSQLSKDERDRMIKRRLDMLHYKLRCLTKLGNGHDEENLKTRIELTVLLGERLSDDTSVESKNTLVADILHLLRSTLMGGMIMDASIEQKCQLLRVFLHNFQAVFDKWNSRIDTSTAKTTNFSVSEVNHLMMNGIDWIVERGDNKTNEELCSLYIHAIGLLDSHCRLNTILKLIDNNDLRLRSEQIIVLWDVLQRKHIQSSDISRIDQSILNTIRNSKWTNNERKLLAQKVRQLINKLNIEKTSLSSQLLSTLEEIESCKVEPEKPAQKAQEVVVQCTSNVPSEFKKRGSYSDTEAPKLFQPEQRFARKPSRTQSADFAEVSAARSEFSPSYSKQAKQIEQLQNIVTKQQREIDELKMLCIQLSTTSRTAHPELIYNSALLSGRCDVFVKRDHTKTTIGEYYLSQVFDLCGFQWLLMIYPHGKKKAKYCSVNLRLVNCPNDIILQIRAQYSFSMNNNTWNRERTFCAGGRGWGTKNFCLKELFDKEETTVAGNNSGHLFTVQISIEELKVFKTREEQTQFNLLHQIEI